MAAVFAATTRWPTKAEVESMAAISFVGRCRLRVGATGASAFMGRRAAIQLPYSRLGFIQQPIRRDETIDWHPEKSELREMGGTTRVACV